MEKSQNTGFSEGNKQNATVSTQLKIVAKIKAEALFNFSVLKRMLRFCNNKSPEKTDTAGIKVRPSRAISIKRSQTLHEGFRRIPMLAAQSSEVHADWQSVHDAPGALDHHPVSRMSAAEHERRKRIPCSGKAQLVQREESQIRLLAQRDGADIVAAKTSGRAFRRPAQGVEMGHGGVIGQAVYHHGVAHALHEIGVVVGGGAIDTQPNGRAGRLKFARAALA